MNEYKVFENVHILICKYDDAQIRLILTFVIIDVKGLPFFLTMTKGEIASLHKSRRCKNLIANLLISRSKNCLLENHYLEYLKKQDLQPAHYNRKQ